MVDRRITRLVKEAGKDPAFVTIDNEADVIKLAGRGAPVDVVAEFGVENARDAALEKGAGGTLRETLRDGSAAFEHRLPYRPGSHCGGICTGIPGRMIIDNRGKPCYDKKR